MTVVDGSLKAIDGRLTTLETDVAVIKENVVKIEVEHGQKLAALFDGYVQNSQKLDQIETAVAKHDELILKRMK